MNRRFVLAAALMLAPFAAQAAGPRHAARPLAPRAVPLPATVRVAITTTLGTITLDLDHAHAPLTVENFVRYADAHRFDGTVFYRAMRLAWGTPPNGLIQGGLQGNPLKLFPPIAHESTAQTGIHHTAGAISMARYAPGTATADFSILLSDLPALDADPASPNPDTQAGFAAFGHVVSGMDVARKIWDSPLSPTKGEGPLKGQMLEPPVRILTVRRIAIDAPALAAPMAAPAPAVPVAPPPPPPPVLPDSGAF